MWKKDEHAELWWGNLIDGTWKTQAQKKGYFLNGC